MNKKKTALLITIIVIIAVIIMAIVIKSRKVEISFDTNGGTTLKAMTINKNSEIERPEDPQREGYIFAGWTLDGEDFDFKTKITKSIKLIANWIKISAETDVYYELTFDVNGGNSVEGFKVVNGDITKLPVPEKDGYKFLGWYNGDEEVNVGDTITSNLELTAKWEKNEEKTNTTKPTTNTTNTTKPSTSEETDIATKPEQSTNTDKTTKYIVTFNSNGGSQVSSQTIEEGKSATQPTEPTKEKYKFLGWYLGDEQYSFNSKVTKDITLTAKWEYVPEITYTVEDVKGSIVNQAKIFVLKDGVKTAGYANVTTNKGTQTVLIPADGLDINKDKIIKIENPRLS